MKQLLDVPLAPQSAHTLLPDLCRISLRTRITRSFADMAARADHPLLQRKRERKKKKKKKKRCACVRACVRGLRSPHTHTAGVRDKSAQVGLDAPAGTRASLPTDTRKNAGSFLKVTVTPFQRVRGSCPDQGVRTHLSRVACSS